MLHTVKIYYDITGSAEGS